MPAPITVDDLVENVRVQTDEANPDTVTTPNILATLNRAQRMAANILCSKWDDFFVDHTAVSLTAGTSEYDIPDDAYGRRIAHIVVTRNGLEYPLTRVRYRDLANYTSNAQVSVPTVYAVANRKYTIKPTPAGGVTIKLWYPKSPETLVLSQGRIIAIDNTNTTVTVDALGSDLDTSTSDLAAFVNVIDASSGKIKVTLQVSALTTSTDKITFKTSGLTFATVYNRTVSTAFPTTGAIEVGDYVCLASGTCVPDVPDSCVDFLVQFGVNDTRRRMGEQVQDETAMLKDFTDTVSRQWTGREAASKIANKSRSWTR